MSWIACRTVLSSSIVHCTGVSVRKVGRLRSEHIRPVFGGLTAAKGRSFRVLSRDFMALRMNGSTKANGNMAHKDKFKLETELVRIGTDPAQRTCYGEPFPLVLEPVNGCNFVQLQEYFKAKHTEILEAASHYGVVKFSGFDIRSGTEWASVLYSSGLHQMEYVGGAAVRNLIVGNESYMNDVQVLTTNESPPSEPILFHHELAQTPNPPDHICFYCLTNKAEGGSTPVLRSDMVYDWLLENYPAELKKFEELGVKYVRTVPEEDDPTSAQGRSWKSMFHVDSREKAEIEMKKDGWSWEWMDNGDCKTISTTLPAVRTSSNGKKAFFNQVVAAWHGWVDSRNKKGDAVVFGDGSLLPVEMMNSLLEFMEANKCEHRWKDGDFVIVDNSVAYHSRQPFHGGRRRVLASIGKGTKEVSQTSCLVLKSGDRMPAVGLGCWKIPNEKMADTAYNAIKAGYRLIDEACDYGNEKEAGAGINKALAEGIVKRDELFVTSKLWNTYHRKEHVKAACQRTLADLGLDYLDLYLIHFPISLKFVPFEKRYPPEWFYDPEASDARMVEDPVPIRETWEAMEELVKEGLVKNIGVCNMGTASLRDILSYAKIQPAVLQVELHPYNAQENLLRFCRENSIAVTGFSNLGAGSYVELNMATTQQSCLEEELVKSIAAKHKRTPAQVVLRWAVQRGTAIIPKTTKVERMEENIDLFKFTLSKEEMESISKLNRNIRFNDPGNFCEQAFNTFFPIYE